MHVLSGLYNNEIVEESVILEWADAEDNKYASEENLKKAQEAAEPFIEWLKYVMTCQVLCSCPL